MLLPIDRLINLPIMSLQTGTELAQTIGYVIDPKQMKIVAFYVDGPLLEEHPCILHTDDVREFSDIGLIVDNSDRLMPLDGLVRLQTIIDLGFELKGMKVIDERKRKLGKVNDFIIEPEEFYIQQLYTQQPFFRSFGTATHIIRRTQIVAVRKDVIIVKSPTVQEEASVEQSATFVNPFRSTSQPEG